MATRRTVVHLTPGRKRPNVALVAFNAPKVAFGAFNAPKATLGRIGAASVGGVETWRVIATTLLAAAGLPLVLVVMAKVRDRTRSSGQVALGGVVTLTLLVVVGVLTLTVLPGAVSWALVAAVAAAVSVMLLAG